MRIFVYLLFFLTTVIMHLVFSQHASALQNMFSM